MWGGRAGLLEKVVVTVTDDRDTTATTTATALITIIAASMLIIRARAAGLRCQKALVLKPGIPLPGKSRWPPTLPRLPRNTES